jgi:hypothetical protein
MRITEARTGEDEEVDDQEPEEDLEEGEYASSQVLLHDRLHVYWVIGCAVDAVSEKSREGVTAASQRDYKETIHYIY